MDRDPHSRSHMDRRSPAPAQYPAGDTLQVRASRTANTLTGATRAIRRAGGLLLMACVIFAISHSLPAAGAIAALAAGCALLTLGEVLHSARAWGISYSLAPPEKQGQ